MLAFIDFAPGTRMLVLKAPFDNAVAAMNKWLGEHPEAKVVSIETIFKPAPGPRPGNPVETVRLWYHAAKA